MPSVLINGDTEFLDSRGDKRGSTTALEPMTKWALSQGCKDSSISANQSM